MTSTSYKTITFNGLWKNNPALVQLLGLCPLLAVTGSVVNAIGMGLATIMVLTLSNLAVASIRNVVSEAVRLPAFVMIIAAAVTIIELLMQAYAYKLYQVLGIFLPLITTNCVILGRADAFASKNSLLPATVDGFMMGMGFALVLVILGAVREIIGTGMIFDNMQLLFGSTAKDWGITVFPNYPNFLVAILPPGAFIFTGFIIAIKNVIDNSIKLKEEPKLDHEAVPDRRVRVTGHIS
jgi:electron transport complex protein RnfE